MLLILALFVSATFPSISSGQSTLQGLIEDDGAGADSTPPQRIGIPSPAEETAPGTIPGGDDAVMKLSANGSAKLGGYCFDKYLIAPRRVTKFNNVLAGNNTAVVRTASGATMSLSDAIAQGAVSVKALQLNVLFTNRTSEPISIALNGPLVLWDRPAGAVNPLALKALEMKNVDEDTRQNQVWAYTTAERRLAVLGYDDGSVWDYNADRQSRATMQFQRDNGLTPSGELDARTIQQLARNDEQLRGRLRSMGFADREGKSLHEDLAAQIRSYQRYAGRPATGRWAPELGDRLAVDEGVLRQLAEFRPDAQKQMAEVLSGDAAPKSVVTYLNGRRGTLMLTETPQGVELWNRGARDLQFTDRGVKAIRVMDDAAAALALQATKADRVVIYPRVGSDGIADVAIGKRTVRVDGKSMAEYLAGGAIPSELATALDPLMPGVSSEAGVRGATPTLIVYRGPFVQREMGTSVLGRLGLGQVDGKDLAGALDRTYGSRASLYLSNDLRIGADRFRTADMGSLIRHDARSRQFADAGLAR